MHWIVYAILFVDTVNMKMKACNTLNAMFVDTVDTGVCKLWKLYSTLCAVASNTIYVDTTNTRCKYS